MSKPVFTIGHSTHELDRFIALLRAHSIEAVADVRSQPYSKFTPQFSRDPIAFALRGAGINYVFLGEELGARRTEPEAYDGERADYQLIASCPAFKRGIDRIQAGAATHRIALMCAEKDPLECHRMLLVARHLRARGLEVQHILDDGRLESMAEADERLLRLLGLDQDDLFASRESRLESAYRDRGRAIAYSRRTHDALESA